MPWDPVRCRQLFLGCSFPLLGTDTFLDVSREVDYFAFVSHLYGKDRQVRSAPRPLTRLETGQGLVRRKVETHGKCDIVNVPVALGIHAGLRRGRTHVGKTEFYRFKGLFCYLFKVGWGAKKKEVRLCGGRLREKEVFSRKSGRWCLPKQGGGSAQTRGDHPVTPAS